MSEPDDIELVERIRQQDQEAFAILVDRYQSYVRRFIAARSSHFDIVEDVVQECFIAAWEQIGKLRDPKLVSSWLCGIAKFKLLNALRRLKNEQSRSESIENILCDHLIQKTDEEDPNADLKWQHLQSCMQAISDRHKKILHARYAEGHSFKKLAQSFKKPLQALSREIQRLTLKLRDCVESKGGAA